MIYQCKIKKIIILGRYGHIGGWHGVKHQLTYLWPYWKMDTGKHNFHEIVLLFETEKKDWKTVERAASTRHRQMHIDWSSTVGLEISLEVRFEVVHTYLAQHCFFLPLPHMPVEFKMLLPPAKKQKTLACIKEIQVHKHWTKVYSQKGLTAMVRSVPHYHHACQIVVCPLGPD